MGKSEKIYRVVCAVELEQLLKVQNSKSFILMGLKKWFDQKWVDIGSKRKDGSYAPCGRSKLKADRKRKYPKCVPAAKAARMTESQRRSAVARKRARAQGVGGKPTNVNLYQEVLWWYDRNLRRINMFFKEPKKADLDKDGKLFLKKHEWGKKRHDGISRKI